MYTLSLSRYYISRTVRVARRDVCASSRGAQSNKRPGLRVVRSLCLSAVCRLTIAISPPAAQSQLEAANRPSRGRCYLEGRR